MTRLLSPASRMRRRRGAAAVMVAIMIPVLLATTGLAVDLGVWYRETTRLQLAADAGAQGAAHLLAGQIATTADLQTAALMEIQGVSASTWIGTLSTPVTVSLASDWSKVTVSLTSQADLYFARIIGVGAPTLHASSTAGLVAMNGCVLALSTTAVNAVEVDNGGSITANGCSVVSNSNASAAINLSSGTIVAKRVAAVGGISVTNGSTLTAGSTATGIPQFNDPLAYLLGQVGSLLTGVLSLCIFPTGDFNTANTNYAFTPRVFCGNTTIGGNNSTASFAPGVYYIINGNLSFNNANITSAAGVTFVLAGGSPGGFSWTNNSNTVSTMTAPTSGSTAGIFIWQGCPLLGLGTTPNDTFSGGSTLQITGEIYNACGAVALSNNAKLTTAAGGSMGIVANTVSVTGSARIGTAGGTSTNAAAQIVLLQ
jgi:Flp pilus assembly protein TadG